MTNILLSCSYAEKVSRNDTIREEKEIGKFLNFTVFYFT